MNQRLLRRDIRRWLTAAGLPVIALTALVWIRLNLAAARGRPTASIPTSGLRVVATAAIVCATVWFLMATTRAVMSPRRDAQAADRLECLRERATQEGYSLWEIQGIEWASAAGQRAVGVDVLSGEVRVLWLERACLDRGTFVLLSVEDGRYRLIQWLDPGIVALAGRHKRQEAVRANERFADWDRTFEHHCRNEADRVIRDAEELLREH